MIGIWIALPAMHVSETLYFFRNRPVAVSIKQQYIKN